MITGKETCMSMLNKRTPFIVVIFFGCLNALITSIFHLQPYISYAIRCLYSMQKYQNSLVVN